MTRDKGFPVSVCVLLRHDGPLYQSPSLEYFIFLAFFRLHRSCSTVYGLCPRLYERLIPFYDICAAHRSRRGGRMGRGLRPRDPSQRVPRDSTPSAPHLPTGRENLMRAGRVPVDISSSRQRRPFLPQMIGAMAAPRQRLYPLSSKPTWWRTGEDEFFSCLEGQRPNPLGVSATCWRTARPSAADVSPSFFTRIKDTAGLGFTHATCAGRLAASGAHELLRRLARSRS